MSKRIKTGMIGLGGRGISLLNLLLDMPGDVEISAVCDILPDRLTTGLDLCRKKGSADTVACSDTNDLLSRSDVDAVIIATSWNSHLSIAAAAMENGKYAAFEVGPAQSEAECNNLVSVYNRTGIPCMMLENCCYGRVEMTLLNMIKKGVFGEIVHCRGGYEHDLRALAEKTSPESHKERSVHYMKRNCDLYPTHGLGPVMKYLGINRGNRMLTLVSMSSKSRGMQDYLKNKYGKDSPEALIDFTQGDIVTTMIKCAGGETIMLTHDTSLPRPYSRGSRLQGTRGLWLESSASIYIEGRSAAHKWEPFDACYDEYEHPLWKEYRAQSVRAGHGGMDYLVLRAFLESVRNGTEPPFDIYDSLSAMSVSYLSEQSIAMGSMPVPIPDFTAGKWIRRKDTTPSIFSLNKVCDELFMGDATF
ncbi:MAG: Gfo/Idh/MocA family oxidoreductase [Eubacteriales bacterium]|nr:Gfo/Idh/MocA family oxidoreductase [Eubacteriales bacterium]